MEFYKPSTIITKNRGLNMIIGARGFGKTYGFKMHVAKRFIKTMDTNDPEQFMYVRVTQKQINGVKDYWGTIPETIEQTSNLGGHKYEYKGNTCYIDGREAGYLVGLSDYLSYKGQEYPHVKYIIVDEFLDTEGWVKKASPPEALLNFIDSIFRLRTDTYVFCLSNAIKLINPYFTYFGIKPDPKEEFTLYRDIAVQIIDKDAQSFVEERKNSWFGRIANETEYAKIAFENEFVDNNTRLLREKPPSAKLLGNIIFENVSYGIWRVDATGAVYVTEKAPPNPPVTISILLEDLDDEAMYRKGASRRVVNSLEVARNNGVLFFDKISTRENGFEFLKKMGIY